MLEEKCSGDFAQWYETALVHLADRHCKVVFRFAESPIERVLLNSLQVHFLRNGQMLAITGPIADFPGFLPGFFGTLHGLREFMEWYSGEGYSPSEMEGYLDGEVARGNMSPEERAGVFEWVVSYGCLLLGEVFHLTVQAGFPNTMPGGRGSRVDALLWHPRAPEFRLAIECDGFEFHSPKESFIRDRQRDRAFHKQDIPVLRFSGSEIWRDPPSAAGELFDHLLRVQEGIPKSRKRIKGRRSTPPSPPKGATDIE